MSLTGFALAQAGQALIRAMSKTTHEGKGCACIAYLCTILRMFPTLLPSCELCSWLALAALGTLPTPPLFGGTFSAAAVRVASFPCGRSKFGFRFCNATFETRFLHFTCQTHTEKTIHCRWRCFSGKLVSTCHSLHTLHCHGVPASA